MKSSVFVSGLLRVACWQELKLHMNEHGAFVSNISAVFAALQTAIDLGIWKAWTQEGGGEKTIDDLVKLTGRDVEPNLLSEQLYSCHVVQS